MNADYTPRGPLADKGYPDYFEAAHLKPEYVDKFADDLAQLFGGDQPKLTKSQMRTFFGEVKRLQTLSRVRPFEDIRNKLLAMKAQAHLRDERGNIPPSFHDFIARNAERASGGPEAFEAFVQHFEAVAAYCEGRLKKD